MGGIMILLAVVVTSLFYMKDYPKILPILFLTLGFGIIGFIDDYIKVVLKRSMGLRAWQKMALQIVVTGLFIYYLTAFHPEMLLMKHQFGAVDASDFSTIRRYLLLNKKDIITTLYLRVK